MKMRNRSDTKICHDVASLEVDGQTLHVYVAVHLVSDLLVALGSVLSVQDVIARATDTEWIELDRQYGRPFRLSPTVLKSASAMNDRLLKRLLKEGVSALASRPVKAVASSDA